MLAKEYQAHSYNDLATKNYFSFTHTSFDFLIFHVAIHCCYNAGRNSLRRDLISVSWLSLLPPCWRQLVGTWFSMIQIKKTLLQIHIFYITTNLSKQCRLAGLHELATVDILYVHINFCSIVLASYPGSWVYKASIVYALLQMS